LNVFQRIVKNMLSLLTAGVLNQFLAILGITYLARVLGPVDFGKINFAFAIASYFLIVSKMGLDVWGNREVARDKHKVQEYASNILGLRICLSLMSYVVLALFVGLLEKPEQTKYLMMFYGFVLFTNAFLLDWIWFALEKMEYVALSQVMGQFCYVGLILLLVKDAARLLWIPWFQVLAGVVTAGLLGTLYVRRFGQVRFSLSQYAWPRLLRQSLPIGLSSIIVALLIYFNLVVLGLMKGDEAVGYYSAAWKITWLLIVLATSFADTIFPVMSQYYGRGTDSLRRLLGYASKAIIAVAVPLAAGGIVLGRSIITLVYGSQYSDAGSAFQILICYAALNYLNMIYARGLWACGKQKTYLIIVSIEALVLLISSLVLVPTMGVVGAAVSILLVETIGIILHYWQLNKVIELSWSNHTIKPGLAAGLMVLFLLAGLRMELNVIILVGGGVLVYSVFFILLKGVTREDLTFMRSVIAR